MAPLVMLTALVGLAPAAEPRPRPAPARIALLAAFMSLALASSYIALTGARLDRDDHEAQLASFRDRVDGQSVLFLGSDEYAPWDLRGASVLATTAAPPGLYQPVDRVLLPRTGERVDFDAYLPATLDRFDYVIAPRSSYASAPPGNFDRVAATDSFVLYQRTGPTPERETLDEGELPGAILDCDSPSGRRISHLDGTAFLFDRPPVIHPFGDLYFDDDETGGANVRLVKEGQPVSAQLELPAGSSEISLQYHSLEPVVVDAPGLLHAELPPVSSRVGPYWRVGTIDIDEPATVDLTIVPQTRTGLRGKLTIERGRTGPETILGAMAATAPGDEREAVPLADACGRLVDYYETGAPTQ
jgi:hypothetical protein